MRTTSRFVSTATLAMAFAVIAGCSKTSTSPSASGTGTAFVFLTDYQSGALAQYEPGDTTATVVANGLFEDDVLRAAGDTLFVIERYGADAIIVYKDGSSGLSAPLANYSVGNSTNPQDIAYLDTAHAYVPRLSKGNLLEINPMTGDSVGTVDISSYDTDADGSPEAVSALVVNGKVYVALELLDTITNPSNWTPNGPGKVIEIDPKTNTVSRTFTLTFEDPLDMTVSDGMLYLAGGPYGDTAHAGIDRIDIATGSVTSLATGATLSGVPANVSVSTTRIWTIVQKTWPNASVYGLDPTTGAIQDSLVGPTAPVAIAVGPGDMLVVSDQSVTAPGLYTFNALTGAKVVGPVKTALPPYGIAFIAH